MGLTNHKAKNPKTNAKTCQLHHGVNRWESGFFWGHQPQLHMLPAKCRHGCQLSWMTCWLMSAGPGIWHHCISG